MGFTNVAICMGSCRNSASLAASRGHISSSLAPALPLDFTMGMAPCKPVSPVFDPSRNPTMIKTCFLSLGLAPAGSAPSQYPLVCFHLNS
ncbi:uncharacterized protein B0T23DRAFT_320727 [Neurospora hispaniola]|uniref:Uncharacterized protein n=1 Tax=Neurospora hispaniola TaxID=588809 RepID=A0AAJ0I2V0_9PEZI|nr:hypothetical protein B0T23DRAFT_320727 [Neurospora hispaniola]